MTRFPIEGLYEWVLVGFVLVMIGLELGRSFGTEDETKKGNKVKKGMSKKVKSTFVNKVEKTEVLAADNRFNGKEEINQVMDVKIEVPLENKGVDRPNEPKKRTFNMTTREAEEYKEDIENTREKRCYLRIEKIKESRGLCERTFSRIRLAVLKFKDKRVFIRNRFKVNNYLLDQQILYLKKKRMEAEMKPNPIAGEIESILTTDGHYTGSFIVWSVLYAKSKKKYVGPSDGLVLKEWVAKMAGRYSEDMNPLWKIEKFTDVVDFPSIGWPLMGISTKFMEKWKVDGEGLSFESASDVENWLAGLCVTILDIITHKMVDFGLEAMNLKVKGNTNNLKDKDLQIGTAMKKVCPVFVAAEGIVRKDLGTIKGTKKQLITLKDGTMELNLQNGGPWGIKNSWGLTTDEEKVEMNAILFREFAWTLLRGIVTDEAKKAKVVQGFSKCVNEEFRLFKAICNVKAGTSYDKAKTLSATAYLKWEGVVWEELQRDWKYGNGKSFKDKPLIATRELMGSEIREVEVNNLVYAPRCSLVPNSRIANKYPTGKVCFGAIPGGIDIDRRAVLYLDIPTLLKVRDGSEDLGDGGKIKYSKAAFFGGKNGNSKSFLTWSGDRGLGPKEAIEMYNGIQDLLRIREVPIVSDVLSLDVDSIIPNY